MLQSILPLLCTHFEPHHPFSAFTDIHRIRLATALNQHSGIAATALQMVWERDTEIRMRSILWITQIVLRGTLCTP